MRKIKLLYVHGYLGHGNGNSSKLIKAKLDKRNISYSLDAPEFPVTEPGVMKEMLSKIIAEGEYNYVIASSLGAFYTMQAFGPFRILVNPAMPENLRRIMESEAAENNSKLSDELIDDLQKRVDYFFDVCHGDESVFMTYIIYGERDNIAGNEAFLKKYYHDKAHIFHVDMEHSLDETGAEMVCDIIEKLEKE